MDDASGLSKILMILDKKGIGIQLRLDNSIERAKVSLDRTYMYICTEFFEKRCFHPHLPSVLCHHENQSCPEFESVSTTGRVLRETTFLWR